MDEAAVSNACVGLIRGREVLAAGDLAAALRVAEEVVEALSRELGEESPDVANALLFRAQVKRRIGQGRPSTRDLLRAVQISRPLRTIEACDRLHYQILLAMGDGLWRDGRYKSAEAWLRCLLRFTQVQFRGAVGTIARVRNLLGVVMRYTGNYPGAMRELRAALEGARLAGDDRMAATVQHNLAGLFMASGNGVRAVSFARHALELRERAAPEDVLALASDRLCLAGVLSANRQSGEALKHAQVAVATYQHSLGREHLEVGFCFHVLAHIAAETGRTQEAARLYRHAITLKGRTLGASHPELASSWLGLADVAAEPCERAHALQQAHELTEGFSPAHPVVASLASRSRRLSRDLAPRVLG